MNEKTQKYLSDILISIDLIEDFTKDINDFFEYCEDLKTQSAVERQLAIIGEALNKIKQQNTNLDIEHSQQIIGFRNRLIHAYDSIDNAIVWAILKKYLGKLKQQIQKQI